jgi:glycosidase
VTFVDLHDISRFMSEPHATFGALQRVFAFLMTVRGIPLIYYGDEIGMPGGGDPDNRRDFSGGWKEDPRNAFEPSGRTPEQQALVVYLQRLGRLRQETPALRQGAMIDLLVEDNLYPFARVTPAGSALVVFNNLPAAATLRIPLAGSGIANGVRSRTGWAPPRPFKRRTGSPKRICPRNLPPFTVEGSIV